MIRMALHIRWGPRKLSILAFTSLVYVIIAGIALVVFESVEGVEPKAPTDYVPNEAGRHFYLTDFSVNGNQPLTTCSAGYHMASIWEIADISNLVYDFNHPDAYTKADSGQGPPSLWYGWVRTGYDSSTTNTAGVGNCANWTSTDGADYGAIVRLTYTWDTPTGALSPWETDTWFCAGTVPVWCVGDWEQLHLPLVMK